MPVIDVDAHFEPGDSWLQAYPEVVDRLDLPARSVAEFIVEFTVGDLFRRVPVDQRPSAEELIPPELLRAITEEKSGESERRGEFAGETSLGVADGAARMKWMEERGVDFQNVICLSGVELAKAIPDPGLAREAVAACNDWLATTTEPWNHRLFPVAVLECSDLDWCVEELKRMRKRGSRQFIIPANPVNGVPAYHPDWDKVWSAATDLGMMAMVHGGYERAEFDPGWANSGGNLPLVRRMAHTQRHQCASILCMGLIFGGVFERHPKLSVVFAEVGATWLPFIRRDLDSRVQGLSAVHCGPWEYPLLPTEYMTRNVLVSPLPSSMPHENPATLMQEIPPSMLCFSSDFPHIEGHGDPVALYEGLLANTGDALKAGFYGDNVNAAYDRMGASIY